VAPRSPTGEPARSDRLHYFFASGAHTVCATRRWWSRDSFRITTLDANGSIVEGATAKLPAEFVRDHPCRRFISVPVTFGDEWSGRLFLFDPEVDGRLPALAVFLRSIVQRVAPALFSVYVLNQLQARATATERARVARELHDGVIQSLISVDLQLEALQRDQRVDTARPDLARLQQIIKDEVLNLRELMQQMRPPELDPDELLDYLADAVQRFGRDTGISARFATDLRNVALPQRVCFELVRIVQEALVNIRKHSAATVAVVRFGAHDGAWRLEIDDNGRGFPFEGRRSQADLDAARLGPVVIKERVKAIGGELVINSVPGKGARLEVSVPQVSHG
jgi:signal transduction histidine kinase